MRYALPALELENRGISKAQWIWRDEGRPRSSFQPGTRYFRRVFQLDRGAVLKAKLSMTADNTFECWVNGQRVLSGSHFRKAFTVDVAEHLQPGRDVIAVAAVNTLDNPNPAGLIGALSVRFADGSSQVLRTAKSCQAAESIDQELDDEKLRQDTSWTDALEQGQAGCPPWGDIDDSINGR